MLTKIGIMGIFIICAQAVIHFCPSQTYTKYLKLLLSMMVMVQLLQPLMTLLIGNSDFMSNLTKELWKEYAMDTHTSWLNDIESEMGYEEQIAQIVNYGLHAYGELYGEDKFLTVQEQSVGQTAVPAPEGQTVTEPEQTEKRRVITPISIQVEELPVITMERTDS